MRLKLVIFLAVFLVTQTVLGQADIPFYVKTANYTTGKKEQGVIVKLMEGSTVISTMTTDAAGEIKLNLKPGKKYKIEVSKAGKVSRSITVNVANVNDELLQGNSKPEGSCQISLFDKTPGIDYSYVETTPITEFYFDGQNTTLQFDAILADKMAKKIEKLMKDAEALSKQGDANYNNIIKQADALYIAKKYEEAKDQYVAALKIKPTEKHPNDRLIEIDGILSAQKAANLANTQIENEYKALITAADALYNQKKYTEAIARYQEALGKKQEQYPKDQITECEYAIEAEKKAAANKEKFNSLMKSAEMFYNQKSWLSARDAYKEALKLVKDDPTATAKLADVEQKILGQKADQERKQNYNNAVAAADALMAEQKWSEAKAKYTEALTFEAAATYPKDKIKEADLKIAEEAKAKALKEQIAKLLTEATSAETTKKYAEAKTKYEQILALDANHVEAKARIPELQKLIDADKANAEKIAQAKQLIAEGTAFENTGKFAEAKSKYEASIALVPDAAIQAKIKALEAKIDAENKKAENKAKFDQAILDGDKAFTSLDLELAKTKYLEAQTLDPNSLVPKQKLQEVEKKLSQLAADKDKEAKYLAAMNAGNSALNVKDLIKAKESFQNAISIDNSKQEAKDKLAEVEKLLAENAKATALKEKFNQTVKAADDLFALGKYVDAKKKYEEALSIDPTQTQINAKIAEIQSLLLKAENDQKILQLLSEGSDLFSKKDWNNAKIKYNQVLALDNTNATASDKLMQIAKIESEAASESEKNAKYEKLKIEGMGLQSQNKYKEAKQKYLEAKAIYNKDEINEAIAWCTKKINEQEKDAELIEKYNAAMEVAKKLEESKQYNEAIAAYNNALTIKDEIEPKNRIAAINTLLANQADKARVDAEYNKLMAKGDELVSNKQYVEAIKTFNTALSLKPTEKLPVEKAENAKKLAESETTDADLAYKKIIDVGLRSMDEKNYSKAKEMFKRATNFRPEDPLPRQKLVEIEQLEKNAQAAKEQLEAFQKRIAEGDAFTANAKYTEAINAYNEAKKIKPDDLLPEQKIEAVKALMSKVADKETDIQRSYDEAMSNGNNAAIGKDYFGAITHYEKALKIKPGDVTAMNKIAEMRQILDEIAKNDAKKAELESLIVAADEKFNASKWSDAKFAYDAILKSYPSNTYAKNQSVICEEKLKSERDADVEKVYQNILRAADKKFEAKNYEKAIELYNRAIFQRPEDEYPRNKIKEINDLLKPPVVAEKKSDNATGQDLELKDLGIETDNTILEGQARLQAAVNEKKSKNARKVKEKLNGITDFSTDLANKQTNSTQTVDSVFSQIKIDNSVREKASVEKQQEIVEVVKNKTQEVVKADSDRSIIQELNTVGQKDQVNNAVLSVEASNAKLNTSSVENNETLKVKTSDLGVVTAEKSNDAYLKNIQNDTVFAGTRQRIEKNQIDDFEQRLAEEKKVKDAVIVNENIHAEKSEAQVQNALKEKEIIENSVTINVQRESENYKVSQIKDQKVKETEQVLTNQNAKMASDHVENTLAFDAKNAKINNEIADINSKRTTTAVENTEKIVVKREEKSEIDRKQYNNQYVKGIDNKAAIVSKEMEIENSKTLPSYNASVENTAKVKQVQQVEIEASKEKQQAQNEKIVSTNNTLTNVQIGIDENKTNNDKSSQNNEDLKKIKENLGTTTTIQANKREDVTTETKKQIEEIESKKPEKTFSGTYDIDLSKYPEGVSQEQFDIPGPDGTLSAIATRRVVVRNGKADVYVRTQGIDVITYQKNGSSITEYIWQKETQDAKLKRNY